MADSNAAVSATHPFDLLLDIDSRCRGRAQAIGGGAEAEQHEPEASRLGLRVGAWRLTFTMAVVAEIIPAPRFTRVPGVKPWLMGIANLRGTVISLIDLGQFLGGELSSQTANSRVVVVQGDDEWRYGLLVDEVMGMRHFEEPAKVAATEISDDRLRPYIDGVFPSEGQLWLSFQVGALLNDARFLDAAV